MEGAIERGRDEKLAFNEGERNEARRKSQLFPPSSVDLCVLECTRWMLNEDPTGRRAKKAVHYGISCFFVVLLSCY